MSILVVTDARLRDGRLVDVLIGPDEPLAVVAAGDARAAADRVVEAGGDLLVPGLHDHHLHLLALAAVARSVRVGPPEVNDRAGLAAALRRGAAAAPPGEWIRAIGYHESVDGHLDRDALDALLPGRPLRVQHRSGAVWYLNSAGLDAVGAERGDVPEGVERDDAGRPTGRVWRADGWLHERLAPPPRPDLSTVAEALAARGVTGVTDATPDLSDSALEVLLGEAERGALPQRLCLLGVDRLPDLPPRLAARVTVGPRKVVLPDHDLPDLPSLVADLRRIRRTRGDGRRPVAVHCVTRTALVLLCAALDEVGPVPGDRIEHASIVPAALLPTLRRLGVVVVTQPGLLATRGDDYLRDVEPESLPDLYRHATLLGAGVPVALSTDAPYTDPDPWRAMSQAVARRTHGGTVIGADERVSSEVALDGFTTRGDAPAGPPRRVESGAVADLCLVADDPADGARLAVVGGRVIHARGG